MQLRVKLKKTLSFNSKKYKTRLFISSFSSLSLKYLIKKRDLKEFHLIKFLQKGFKVLINIQIK